MYIYFSLRPSISMNGPVSLFVCLSVCLSHLFYYAPIIISSWNLQELFLLTNAMPMQNNKVRSQRSMSQRSKQILPKSVYFLYITLVWFDKWLWNYAYSLNWNRKCVLYFFKVCQISRSHGIKNHCCPFILAIYINLTTCHMWCSIDTNF